jgi:hypothetical protein
MKEEDIPAYPSTLVKTPPHTNWTAEFMGIYLEVFVNGKMKEEKGRKWRVQNRPSRK